MHVTRIFYPATKWKTLEVRENSPSPFKYPIDSRTDWQPLQIFKLDFVFAGSLVGNNIIGISSGLRWALVTTVEVV